MLLDVQQRGANLTISYYDKEGNTNYKQYRVDQVANWEVCRENDKNKSDKFTNWDGRPVKRVAGRGLDKYSLIQFIDELSFEETDEIFGYNLPKTYFVDIEVEVKDGFPEAERADTPVTTIAIVTPNAQAIVLATGELPQDQQQKIQNDVDEYFKATGTRFSFVYKKFDSEYDLLYTFFKSFVSKFPMVTGWNFINFDWKYLVNRASKLAIDPAISSPVGELWGKENLPLHVGMMDYLELYRKWDRSDFIKENFTLDSTAESVVGLKKIKYNGTIQDLYEKEYTKYVYYNVVDTCLVYLIHQKLRTMDIALTIATMCKIGIYKAASPVAVTESMLCRKFLEQNKVMARDFSGDSKKDSQYAGAYVKAPVVGMHRAVACFDFASLYPSIMRQINISPESFIHKIDPVLAQKEKSPDKIVSVTGAIYRKEDSILKNILTELYTNRKVYKGKSKEYQIEADELKKEIEKLKNEI
jgi:DNA polymerase elongation subunit (family B)